MYKTNIDFIEEINLKQNSWKATSYEFLNNMKISELIKMAGGKKSRIYGAKPKPAIVDEETRAIADLLPDNFGLIFLNYF